jgi:hypothetical protein
MTSSMDLHQQSAIEFRPPLHLPHRTLSLGPRIPPRIPPEPPTYRHEGEQRHAQVHHQRHPRGHHMGHVGHLGAHCRMEDAGWGQARGQKVSGWRASLLHSRCAHEGEDAFGKPGLDTGCCLH